MQSPQSLNKTLDKKEEIRRCAKELFSTNGFKETNVSDITQKAGIAAGTFYLYYGSKDKLFMELFLEENVKLKKSIMQSVDLDKDPLSVIQEVMHLNMSGINGNPILREWYNKDVFNKIEKNYRAENGLEQVDFMYSNFLEIVKKWQEEGKMRTDISSGMIMAMFTAIVLIDTHKDEIGLQYFPQVQIYLTDFVIKGLTPGTDPVQPEQGKRD